MVASTELTHLGHQALTLLFELLARGRRLFHERRVLLRHRVHLRDGSVHLIDALRLLFARRGDFRNDVADLVHRLLDLGERLARLVHQRRAGAHFVDRVDDQLFDLLRGAGAALSEAAHFTRDDSEAPALLAGARRFDGGIQRQQVGLERDLVDHTDDVGDLAAGRIDLFHRPHGALDHGAAFFRMRAGVRGELIRLARVIGVLFHRRGHFLHAGGGLFQRRRLFLRAVIQIVVAARDFERTARHRARQRLGGRHDFVQLADEAIQGARDFAELGVHRRQLISEIAIAGAQIFGGSQHLAQWVHDAARDHHSENDRQHHGERAATQQHSGREGTRILGRLGALIQQALLDAIDLVHRGPHLFHVLLAWILALECHDIGHARAARDHFFAELDRGLDCLLDPFLSAADPASRGARVPWAFLASSRSLVRCSSYAARPALKGCRDSSRPVSMNARTPFCILTMASFS